jgi:hypothetical protein
VSKQDPSPPKKERQAREPKDPNLRCRAYKFRLYPTRKQVGKLEWMLRRCKELYNAALQERRDAYKMCGVSVSYHMQAEQLPAIKQLREEYQDIHSPASLSAQQTNWGRKCPTGTDVLASRGTHPVETPAFLHGVLHIPAILRLTFSQAAFWYYAIHEHSQQNRTWTSL